VLASHITLPKYTWVDGEVVTHFSRYNHESDLLNLLSWLMISTITEMELCSVTLCTVRLDVTLLAEFVFMNRVAMNKDFFYMYDCLFHDLHVRVLFDDFTMGVLRILNVVLVQLHPNGWASMQVFYALCLYSFLPTTPGLFLHYFSSRPQDKARWISLIRISKHPFFCPFTFSYKNFKIGYFKVTIRPLVRNNFSYKSMGNSMFPFYWQQCPR